MAMAPDASVYFQGVWNCHMEVKLQSEKDFFTHTPYVACGAKGGARGSTDVDVLTQGPAIACRIQYDNARI